MYKLLLILLLAVCTGSCGIFNGSDENESEEEPGIISEFLINGKPWQEYHPHDTVRIDTVYSGLMTLSPDSSILFNLSSRRFFESPYWEGLTIRFVFPPDTDFSELELPYSVSYDQSTHDYEFFSFTEFDYDVAINRFGVYDSLHPPEATITQFDLENEIFEVEFEGTLIVDPEFEGRDNPSRWSDVDTLRITEGRHRTVHFTDRRD